MTTLTRFVLRHALIGTGAAILFVALLLAFDVGSIGSLAARSEGGALAVVVMTVFFAITFGSVQIGFALMLAARDRDDDDGPGPAAGGGGGRAPRLAPAPVPARARRTVRR